MKYEIRIIEVNSVCEKEPEPFSITRPEDFAKGYLDIIKNQDVENFVVITLNGSNKVINTRIVTVGLLNHSLVHPRETFRPAIMDNAAAIIIAHNHPSGSLEPSSNDIAITRTLVDAGGILGIKVLDHIIVSSTGFLSMRERGLM